MTRPNGAFLPETDIQLTKLLRGRDTWSRRISIRTELIDHVTSFNSQRHTTIKSREKGARKRDWKKRKKEKKRTEESRRRKESRCPFRRPIHNWPHVCNEQLAGRRRSECTCGTMNSDPSDRQRNGYTQGGEGGVARYPTEGGGMCSTFWVHFPRGRQRTTSHSSLSSTEDILSTDIDTVRAIVVEPWPTSRSTSTHLATLSIVAWRKENRVERFDGY